METAENSVASSLKQIFSRRLLASGVSITGLLPAASITYEIWSLDWEQGMIKLRNRFVGELSYADALRIYRSYRHGAYALVVCRGQNRKICKFKYEGENKDSLEL